MGYKLFIDESGDQGIDRDNEGQSKLFFFGGFVVSSTYLPYLSSFIEFCEKEIEQKIHFKRLTHEKKVFFCNKLSKLPICCFGLISDKKGLDRGNYREKITRQKGFFYNKNAHYFLEAVGDLCEQKPLELDEIIFEKIENKNYAQMKGYLHTIKNNPLHPNAKRLTKIPINRIDAKAKSEEPLLKIADAISHSLYRACIKDSFGHTEHR